jgi:hypothetical protein
MTTGPRPCCSRRCGTASRNSAATGRGAALPRDLAPFDEQLEEGAQLNLTFRGPFTRLIGYGQSRGRFTAASFTRTATDAGQIAKALIDTYGIGAGVATTGTITASKTRDRAYQYANVGEAIVNLTRVFDGFDFEVIPIEYTGGNIGQLVVYAAQGSDRTSTVRFQYGPGTLANCRSVNRQIEPPINTARVIGANGLVGLKTDAGSIATFGEMWVQENASDVGEQATLDDKAQALLRPTRSRSCRSRPTRTWLRRRGMTTGSVTRCRSSAGAARSMRTRRCGSTRSRSSSTTTATRRSRSNVPGRSRRPGRTARSSRRSSRGGHRRDPRPGGCERGMSDKRGSVTFESIIGQLRDRIARLERGSIGPPVYTTATLPAATTVRAGTRFTCPTPRPARRCSIRTGRHGSRSASVSTLDQIIINGRASALRYERDGTITRVQLKRALRDNDVARSKLYRADCPPGSAPPLK